MRAAIEAQYASHVPEFEIALHTGMRPSEQYSLTWDRVDLFGRRITIPRSKNGKVRHIPLNSKALAAFKALARRPADGTSAVFVNLKGEELQGYKHWFGPAVENAGIRDFTWYCLRHTFASRLVMAGVDIRTVAELMGHETIQMTTRYAHLAPEHNLAAVERLTSFNSVNSCPGKASNPGSSPSEEVIPEVPTDTTADTEHESEIPLLVANVQ